MDKQSLMIPKLDDEIRKGLSIIDKNDKIISVFGSARIKPENSVYKYAQQVCQVLAEDGFAIMTGGGPGIMEAAAKGAYQVGGVTYGINIDLPHEQDMNPYISRPFLCDSLLSRKYLLMNYSLGFVIFDGGFGTLDELFEVLTLMTTEKMKISPIVLAGSDYWIGLKNWLEETLMKNGYISPSETDMLQIINDPREIASIFKKT